MSGAHGVAGCVWGGGGWVSVDRSKNKHHDDAICLKCLGMANHIILIVTTSECRQTNLMSNYLHNITSNCYNVDHGNPSLFYG